MSTAANPSSPAMKLVLLLTVLRVVALPMATLDTALVESPRSFEKTLAQLETKIASAEQKTSVWGRTESWTAGVIAGLTMLANGAYEVGYALNLADHHRHSAKLEELRAAADRANAAAPHRDAPSRAKAKRAEVALIELESEGGALEDALGRSSSERLDQIDAGQDRMDRTSRESDTHDRLGALEAAVLRQEQRQLKQVGTVPTYAKVLVGVGAGNAVIAAAAAELSVQDTLEMHRKAKEQVPDVRNLDRKMCERFVGEVDGLDCEMAKGKALP